MNVLVTGGAGFIGSNLVDELMMNGFEVTVLDNMSEGKIDNVARWLSDPNFNLVRGDIRDAKLVSDCARGKEIIFHLAAMSRIQPSITDPLSAYNQNYIGTANVLEAARENKVKRVVYSASSSAYGSINTPPMTEDMPTDCLNPYSLSKKGGEELMTLYHELYGISTISLRYFNVYGPRHQEEGSYSTVIAVFRKQKREGRKLTVVGDGEQRRDFTFVGDVVRANMMAAMNRDVFGVHNIGTGVNYSINQIANLISPENDSIEYIPPRPGEARITLASYKKAQENLDWSPSVNIVQGLQILDMYEKKMGTPGSKIVLV